MPSLSAVDIPFGGQTRAIRERKFSSQGESYRFECLPAGIVFEMDRMRRSSHELWGELVVKVNGNFPNAKTFDDGVLQTGDLNLSSVQARNTRAKILKTRAACDSDVDWEWLIEEFSTRVLTAERIGEPSIGMTDIPISADTDTQVWTVEGVPLLSDLPFVLFGDAAAAKSYLALWLSGTLAQRGIPVLYLDWEFSGSEHKKRLERLFSPPPSPQVMRYHRCDKPFIRMLDWIAGEVKKWKIQYLVCDSIGFAVEGSPLDAEAATRYFTSLRRFNVGSLHLAHIAKAQDEGKDATIFGSNYFRAGARSAWYIERTTDNPDDEIRVGLYHRKFNGGREQRKPLGFKLAFETKRTRIEAINLETVDELAANLPLIQRLRKTLADGPMAYKRLSEDLATPQNVLRSCIAKHKSSFIRVGDKLGLAPPKTEEMAF